MTSIFPATFGKRIAPISLMPNRFFEVSKLPRQIGVPSFFCDLNVMLRPDTECTGSRGCDAEPTGFWEDEVEAR
jgi:hypothetical protein